MRRHLFVILFLSFSLSAACADLSTDRGAGPAGKADSTNTDPAAEPYLHCWDHTFFYNMLTFRQHGETIEILLQGAEVDIAQYAPNEDNWNPAEATLTLPADACIRSTDDPRLLACGGGDVPVRVQQFNDGSEVIDGVLHYAHVETTFAVRTDAEGSVRKSIEMRVATQSDEERTQYVVNFPAEDGFDACTTDGE